MHGQELGKALAALIFIGGLLAVVTHPQWIGVAFVVLIIGGLFGAVLKVAGWGLKQ